MTPIYLGNIKFDSNVFYAPLAGCSDFAFRQMAKLYNPGLFFCEMVKMEALVRGDPNTFRLLDYSHDMHPIGAQLCGSKPDAAGIAAAMVEDLGFDVIDLNCGCPVDKVTKDNSGSGLLKYPDLIGEILISILKRVSIPVTVKIRVGWDDESIVAPQITKIAEEVGAKAIFIHGRTREQAYKGRANWDYIKECAQLAKNIKVFGNGDVFSAEDALKLLSETNCDGVLVSRGTLGQPWIAEDIYRLAQGLPVKERSIEECKEALITHFNYIRQHESEKKVLIDMRRIGCWYFKKSEQTKSFRRDISRAQSVTEVENLIHNFYPEENSSELVSSGIYE